jgi:phosphoribosylformylglycinamidine synthase subunit PurQ / glutaminase
MKKIGILRFWGTNCDRDIWQAGEAAGLKPQWLWQDDQFNPSDFAFFVVPGGFSYGDYLRCGSLAAKAPVMKSLRDASKKGAPVIGICNGFQILCEAQLLPGALVQNVSRRFIDDWAELKVANKSPFATPTSGKLKLPIAHGEGRFFLDEDDLKRVEDKGQVWLRYMDNPNGSLNDIAGVMNEAKNVCGLMPHPERALFDWMGGADGKEFFEKVGSAHE